MRLFQGLTVALVVLLCSMSNNSSVAAIILNENFDSIGPTGTVPPSNFTTGNYTPVQNAQPPGGHLNQVPMAPNDGTNVNKGFSYNYGAAGSNERSIGTLPTTASGDRAVRVGVRNSLAAPIQSFTLTYTGEQWTSFVNTPVNGNALNVYFSLAFDGSFQALPASLTFTNPVGDTLAGLDGNAPANRTVLTGTFTPANPIPVGATFYITWHDINDPSVDDAALAIDDVMIDAHVVPEPRTLVLLGAGLSALAFCRRWRDRSRRLSFIPPCQSVFGL